MTNYKFSLVPFKQIASTLDINASLTLNGSNIELEFVLIGELEKLLLSPIEEVGRRVIGLWESTCFECFILNNETLSYYEFNFSPEGHWNSFYFPKKKSPLKEAESFSGIKVRVSPSDQAYKINVSIDLYCFIPGFWKEGEMSFGLTSVVESDKGLSYWAISHQDEKPNFHNFNTFEKIDL